MNDRWSWGVISCGLFVAALASGACGADRERSAPPVVAGAADPLRGQEALARYGCRECHTIPGVPARGRVGPSLAGLADRAYIAGTVSNTHENLIRWLFDPRAVSPATGMPDVGVTDQDARDIAAFLHTLR